MKLNKHSTGSYKFIHLEFCGDMGEKVVQKIGRRNFKKVDKYFVPISPMVFITPVIQRINETAI